MSRNLLFIFLLSVNVVFSDSLTTNNPQRIKSVQDSIAAANKGDEDDDDNSEQRNAGYRQSVKSSVLRPILGETYVITEQRFGRFGVELLTGYVYKDLYSNDLFDINKSKVRGFVTGQAVRFYRNTKGKRESYFSIKTYFKTLKRDTLTRPYGTRVIPLPHERRVCTYCEVTESTTKQVYSLQTVWGHQWRFGRFFIDYYFGPGFRVRVFESDIHAIFNNELFGYFQFSDYKVRSYQYYLTLNAGLRVGLKTF